MAGEQGGQAPGGPAPAGIPAGSSLDAAIEAELESMGATDEGDEQDEQQRPINEADDQAQDNDQADDQQQDDDQADDDAEADAANIALNPAPDDPGYDVDVLAAILADVAKTDAGYEGTGHDAGTLEELLAAVAEFPTLPGAPDIPAVQPFAVADLKPHPRNYQEHTEEQLDHLAQAIQQHGFYKNIVLARDLTILAGHGAVLAAGTRLQMEKVPAVRLDLDPNDPQALKIIAADNEIAKRGTRDDRSLTELLREVAETDTFGLAGTGFDEMILANLLMVTRSTAEVRDVDAAAEWVGLPSYEPKQKSTQLVINFETPADRDEFIKTSFNGTVSKRTSEQSWSAHWPVREEPRESRFVQWELDPEGEA